MRIVVTKLMLLDAIKNEPIEHIQPNAWFDIPTATGNPIDLTHCPRCMVGAFMGNIVSDLHMVKQAAEASTEGGSCTPNDVFDYDDVECAALYELRNSTPMNALSVFFEGLCVIAENEAGTEGTNMETIRGDVYDFVLREFPDDFEVDIDGAKLKEGLVVQILED